MHTWLHGMSLPLGGGPEVLEASSSLRKGFSHSVGVSLELSGLACPSHLENEASSDMLSPLV